eukprot:1808415-Rhodomonas_salina.2
MHGEIKDKQRSSPYKLCQERCCLDLIPPHVFTSWRECLRSSSGPSVRAKSKGIGRIPRPICTEGMLSCL